MGKFNKTRSAVSELESIKDDVRERIQERSLNNYLAGRSRMPLTVEKGLNALIERGADQ